MTAAAVLVPATLATVMLAPGSRLPLDAWRGCCCGSAGPA